MATGIHLFKCDKSHDFYIPLSLPRPLVDVGKLFQDIVCPICQSKKITINAQEFMLVDDSEEDGDE